MMKQAIVFALATLFSAILDPVFAFVQDLRPTTIHSSNRQTRGWQSPRQHQITSVHATSTSNTQEEKSLVSSKVARENDVILYDGICNFCNTWVDVLLRIDVNQKFRFAPLQSSVGQELLVSIGKEADDISSVVLVKANSGESYDKSRCVLKVVEELGPVAALASRTALAVVPESIRDSVYDTVAENRYNLMGKRDECRCSDPEFADRFLLD